MSKLSNIALTLRDKSQEKRNVNSKYIFDDRIKGYEKYLIILAGYKTYLYDIVFERLNKFIPDDIDVCLITSGKLDNVLRNYAREKHWSYLSTKKNKVAVAQNLAIKLNKYAKYIYKMDEDIFLTAGSFETLYNTYTYVKKFGNSDIGFIAPIMPLNGFGYMKILEKYDLLQVYEDKFQKPLFSSDPNASILKDPDVAKFFWGNGNYIKDIDALNDDFQNSEFGYSLCPIRFSIGLIMFEKSLWQSMGMFKVPVFGAGMGIDEAQLCAYCVNESKPIVVSNNTVVGHFSFGPQTKEMIKYLNTDAMKYYRS